MSGSCSPVFSTTNVTLIIIVSYCCSTLPRKRSAVIVYLHPKARALQVNCFTNEMKCTTNTKEISSDCSLSGRPILCLSRYFIEPLNRKSFLTVSLSCRRRFAEEQGAERTLSRQQWTESQRCLSYRKCFEEQLSPSAARHLEQWYRRRRLPSHCRSARLSIGARRQGFDRRLSALR